MICEGFVKILGLICEHSNFFLLHSTFWLRAASYMLKNPELLEKFATIAMASVGSGKDEEAISWTSGTKIPLSFYNYVYIYI
jgi:hypothetical protein